MKRQILSALAIGSMLMGSATILPAPASASGTCPTDGSDIFSNFTYTKTDFKPWEHPFACREAIQNMSQAVADAYCKSTFGFYVIAEVRVPKYSHIWAHRKDHLCIYND